MDPVIQSAKVQVLSNIKIDKTIKSPIGIVHLACKIVEDIAKSMGGMEGKDKQELAKDVLRDLIVILKDQGVIGEEIAFLATTLSQTDAVADTIDDVVAVLKDNSTLIKEGCSVFRRLLKMCSRN